MVITNLMKAEMCVHGQREEYQQAKHEVLNRKMSKFPRHPVKLENIKYLSE